MNDAPRRKLREIIERHGRIIIENPRRVESLLRDYCGEFRREISVLTMALEERAAADLLSSSASALPLKVTMARLAQRLCDNLALSETAARWAIESWAWALGVISDAEFAASVNEAADEQNDIETAENKSSKAPQASQIKQVLPAPKIAPTNHPAPANQTARTQAAIVTTSNSVFVVSANGGGNYASISEALRNVAANSRLLIREGLYEESIILDKNVTLEGEGAIENIVVRSENRPCVSMQTKQAQLSGLTFEGRGGSFGASFFAVDVPFGELVLENCDISSDTLSCVAIHGASANPTLKSCRVRDGADSGIYIFDNARALIENCDVYRNANVNLAIAAGANPIVKNCRIFAGENGGVVVWGNGATATIEDCEITNHRLANVGVSQSANPIFRRCTIYGGRDSGVFIQQNGYGTFEECEVYGNAKAEVAVAGDSNTTLRRCTIHNGQDAGVLVAGESHALLEGCNIYDNRGGGVFVNGVSQIEVRRCNIHRNGKVAIRVKENSRARVEDSDLRGNRVATWETDYGVTVERKNNRE